MAPVESLGVDAIELTHALDEVAVRRFDEQVVVVTHLTIGKEHPVETFADLPQDIQPKLPVLVFQIHV